MNGVKILPGHDYTITFKGKAEGRKYAYVDFGSENPEYAPQGDDIVKGDAPVIALTSTEKTFSYTLTNWAETQELNVLFGKDWSNVITDYDAGFRGNVYISDFKVIDLGQNPEYETEPTIPTTTGRVPNDVIGLEGYDYYDNTYLIYWNSENDADYYNIYLDGELIGDTSNTYYYINKNFFYENKDYEIEVEAVNDYGNSNKSKIIYSYEEETAGNDNYAPDKPRAIRGIEDKNNNYYVYWESSQDVDYYNVYLNNQFIGNTLSTYYLMPASYFQNCDNEIVIEIEAVNNYGTSERGAHIYVPSNKTMTTRSDNVSSKQTTITKNVVSQKQKKPAKVNIKRIKNLKKRKIKVNWTKQKNISGYQIAYANNKKFTKKVKTKNIIGNKDNCVLKKLKKKKTYWIKIRAFVQKGTTRLYGLWSNAKKVKIKK